MKITEMRVDVTLNKGNFENEKIGVTAIVEESDNVLALRKHLLDLCKGVDSELDLPIEKAIKEVEKVKEKKSKKEKAEEKDEVVEETIVKVETSTEEEPVIEEKPKEEKKSKKTKVVYTKYDRNLKLHKELFANMATEIFGDWKSISAKVKAASMLLEKTDFLDENGEILESFKFAAKKAIDV